MRKKRRLTEKTMPERLAAAIPESEMFAKLVAFEQEVDLNLQRRRFELHEDLRRPTMRKQKLRVWIYHTYTAGPELPDADPAGWTLKIVGKLLPDERTTQQYYQPQRNKFTSFVKSIQLQLTEPNGQEQLVEWHKPPGFEEVDGIEIKRAGDTSLDATVLMHLDFSPKRFQLSQPLRETLELADQPETRGKVLEVLWHYIKMLKLQDSANALQVNNNKPLKKLFGCDRMEVSQLFKKLDDHLSPLAPVKLEHKIRLYGDPGDLDQCYDIDVQVNEPAHTDMERFFTRTQQDGERKLRIDQINNQILSTANEIKTHQEKRQFYKSIHAAPNEMLNQLIATMAQDHKRKQLEKAGAFNEAKQASHYHKPWVEEAVPRYLVMRSLTEHGNQF